MRGSVGRFGTKRVYLAGLVASLTAMALLIVSAFFESNTAVALPLLLLGTAFLGVGFGLAVPALNTLTAAFHPDAVETSVLVLNALLGLGTALAPVFVAIFVGLGFWWGLPVLSSVLLTAAHPRQRPAAAARGERRDGGARAPGHPGPLLGLRRVRRPLRHLRDRERQLVPAGHDERARRLDHRRRDRAHGLLGDGHRRPHRVRGVQRWVPSGTTYRVLPFLLAVTFVLIALLGDGDVRLGVLAFGLAGLCCSALLPLTISFGQEELVSISAAMAGGVIAFYQLGYGIAAFGVGPLIDRGVGLPTVYGVAAIIAFAMGLLSFAVVGRTSFGVAPEIIPLG